MTDDIWKILSSLSDRFFERRALKCLLHFLPAYFGPNEVTDGWENCRQALANTRASCKEELRPDETEDINKAMNLIDRMLENR